MILMMPLISLLAFLTIHFQPGERRIIFRNEMGEKIVEKCYFLHILSKSLLSEAFKLAGLLTTFSFSDQA